MTQFNLEKALAGAPVVTRLGWKVKISGYNPDAECCLVGWYFDIKMNIWIACWWDSKGKLSQSISSEIDLFMAPIKKTGFINIFHPVVKLEQVPDARDVRGGVYDTEDLAKTSGSHKEGYIATVPVEWEEI